MIGRLMVYTIGTGLLTSVFALAAFVTSFTSTNTLIFALMLEMLPKRESLFQGRHIRLRAHLFE